MLLIVNECIKNGVFVLEKEMHNDKFTQDSMETA